MSYYGKRRYNPPASVAEASTIVGPFTGGLDNLMARVAHKSAQAEALHACDADPAYWPRQQLLAAEGRTHAILADWIKT